MSGRESRLHAELTTLWLKSRPELLRRLAVLEQAVYAAAAGSLIAEQRAVAIHEAHRLIGAIGNFGFGEGAEAAREIEAILQASAAPDPARLRSLLDVLRTAVGREVLPSAGLEDIA